MKKATKSKNQKVDEDADHGDSKKKASNRSNTKNQRAAGSEDEDAPTPTTEKVSTALNSEGLNREESVKEESKGKKSKKRKKDIVAASEEDDELTPKKKKKKKKAKEKVFDLPGQKRTPPDERDPSRIFYETLYEQVPDCELAQIWMMESGLLPIEEAKQVYKKKRNKTLSSPVEVAVAAEKSIAVQVKPSSPVSSSKKKRSEDSVTLKNKKSKKRKEDRT